MDSKLVERLNFYNEFREWYNKISCDFGFNYQKDSESRDYLSNLLQKKVNIYNLELILNNLQTLIRSKSNIIIYGCGPSLESTVDILLKEIGKKIFRKCLNITADGAATLLRERGIPIHSIFSDLDGITFKEFNSTDFMIIHAHGDNLDKLELFKSEILKFKNIIGTTQVEPSKSIINPGGFTDGDRILYFLRPLLSPMQDLFLIGMDFKNVVGKYSKLHFDTDQEASPIKQKKLQYAVELIKWIKNKIPNNMYFVNSSAISEKFNSLSIKNFINIIRY
ncbi:MAG: 6-hydroxymethylpterin diphosphokinase MptE-like protein [Promethearchaeota archaeon]